MDRMVGLASRGERGTTAEPWSCHDEGVLYTMGLQWAEKVTPAKAYAMWEQRMKLNGDQIPRQSLPRDFFVPFEMRWDSMGFARLLSSLPFEFFL